MAVGSSAIRLALWASEELVHAVERGADRGSAMAPRPGVDSDFGMNAWMRLPGYALAARRGRDIGEQEIELLAVTAFRR